MMKHLLKTMLVAGMLAIGINAQAKDDVTDQYLQNADLKSLDGWQKTGYTDWKTDGAVPVIEFWNWTNAFSFTQTITLPEGDYRLAVNSFYRESWQGNGTNNNMAWIFAGEKKQNVIALKNMGELSSYAGSNDLYKAATAFSQGKFSNEFDFSIGEGGQEITLGFTGTTPNGGWCILGPVKLYQYTLDDYLVDYRVKVAEAEPYLTEKMSAATLEALKAAMVDESTLKSSTAIAEAISTLNNAIIAANASIDAYKKLFDALEKGKAFIEESIKFGAPESCSSALDAIEAGYDEGTIADADVAEKIAEIQTILLSVAKMQTKAGADMTLLLTNPDFELNASSPEGWTVVVPNYGYGNAIVGGNDFNHCFEAWCNPGFDVYQVVENAPFGVYEIEVQGFYRYLRDEDAWNAYQAQELDYVKPAGVPVYIYMNDNATPFTNIFAETPVQTGELYTTDQSLLNPNKSAVPYVEPSGQYWYPNEMYNSAMAFSQGMYKQSAYGLVAFDGDVLRLGVKGASNQGGDSWVIWDNFKLIYRGFDPAVIKPVLEVAVKDIEDNYIGLLMGKTEYAAFTKALADAEKAIEDNDGEGMFKALKDLYAAKDPALISKDIFLANKVANDTVRLAEAIREVEGKKLAKSTLEAANALLKGLKENTIYENEDAVVEEETPSKIQNDVSAMIDRLNYSIALYQEMNDVTANLRDVINAVKKDVPQLNKLAEADNLCKEADDYYNNGTLDDDKAPSFIQKLRDMIQSLQTLEDNYLSLKTSLDELKDKIAEATTKGVGATDIANAQGVYDAALAAFNAGEMDSDDIAKQTNNVQAAINNLNTAITTVGIANVTTTSTDAPAYNLGGQQVKNQKGLIIKTGKKVVRK